MGFSGKKKRRRAIEEDRKTPDLDLWPPRECGHMHTLKHTFTIHEHTHSPQMILDFHDQTQMNRDEVHVTVWAML